MRGLLLLCSWLVAFGLRAQADSTQALVISAAYSLPLSQAQVIERAQRAWTKTFGREPGPRWRPQAIAPISWRARTSTSGRGTSRAARKRWAG
ncbi:MAG: hypothetical protein IPM68_05880 [Flavobacteriales bacterium]|nr:hypothetical protein [Flavobacteriales bacterium]